MATVTERWKGKGKSRGNYASDTALRIFDVIATSEDAAMDAVASMTGSTLWPAFIGNPFDNSGDGKLYCSNVACRDQSVGFYEVTATYGVGNYVPSVTPTSLPWKYRWRTVTVELPFDRDINGNKIVNSAGFPFTTPPTKRVSYKALTITSTENFYNYGLYKQYENTVNTDTIQLIQPDGSYTNFGPGTIFCVSIEPGNEYTKLDNYLTMVKNFEIWDLSTLPSSVSDPFQLQLLDQGPTGWYAGPYQAAFWDKTGSPVSSDQQLDGTGKPVDPSLTCGGNTPISYGGIPGGGGGAPPGATVLNPTTNAFYLKYKRYVSTPLLPLLAEPR